MFRVLSVCARLVVESSVSGYALLFTSFNATRSSSARLPPVYPANAHEKGRTRAFLRNLLRSAAYPSVSLLRHHGIACAGCSLLDHAVLSLLGKVLCIRGTLAPCTVTGDINRFTNAVPAGWRLRVTGGAYADSACGFHATESVLNLSVTHF